MKSAIERFMAKVSPEPNTGCWLWAGAMQSRGYGFFTLPAGKMILAHRYAYEFFRGLIAPGMQIDHVCRLKACVNPDHLEVVAQSENMLRRYRAARGEPVRFHNNYTMAVHDVSQPLDPGANRTHDLRLRKRPETTEAPAKAGPERTLIRRFRTALHNSSTADRGPA